ncbi:MAG: M20 family metallo-hydrolase [Synergistaceae bacterium]|nr:M20 family metallo-hydrolase [Synergistaceae bacterium]
MTEAGDKKYIELRRELHAHAETGWTEFWTTARVAGILSSLGYEVLVGKQVLNTGAIMGRPSEDAIAGHIERAISQGADPAWIEKMAGYTGAAGILDTGRPGPVTAFRFDMDAVDVSEARDEKHRPFKEGFASKNAGAMHSCGHDAHMTIGLALAEILMMRKDGLTGIIKLIFQPAEEGVRGGKAVAESGILDDVDWFFGAHIGMGVPTGSISQEAVGFLCTTKFDVTYKGRAAHAGGAPNEGKNALLAACSASLALAGIAPHKDGPTRVNVGFMQAGTGRNVIPADAVMKVETRGSAEAINNYVYDRAMEVVRGAAEMYGVEMTLEQMGAAVDALGDKEAVDIVKAAASESGAFGNLLPPVELGGSEDVSWMIKRVQKGGGKAAYFIIGSNIAAGHHNEYFDLDETVILPSAELMAALAESVAKPA